MEISTGLTEIIHQAKSFAYSLIYTQIRIKQLPHLKICSRNIQFKIQFKLNYILNINYFLA